MFKNESTVTRMLLKVNIDSLISVIYKEYNDLTIEVRQKKTNKRKHNQSHVHIHYDFVDNEWFQTGMVAPYFMQPDFGGNSLRIVQDWDLNQEEAYITMVTTVPRTRMPMHFGDIPTVPLVNAIDSYNFHMMQYMRLYRQ